MVAVILFIIVLYGIKLAIKAIVGTGVAEAYGAMVDMAILMVILVLCGFYIYMTRTQTILIIN